MKSLLRTAAWTTAGLILIAAVVVAAQVSRTLLAPLDIPSPGVQSATNVSAITVTIAESYLNRRLAQELARRDPAGQIRGYVDVQPGRLVNITVEGKIGLSSVRLFPKGTIVTQLSAGGDEPILSIVRMEVAGMPIPRRLLPEPARQIVDMVEREINVTIDTTMQRQGLRIGRTETTDRAITVDLMLE